MRWEWLEKIEFGPVGRGWLCVVASADAYMRLPRTSMEYDVNCLITHQLRNERILKCANLNYINPHRTPIAYWTHTKMRRFEFWAARQTTCSSELIWYMFPLCIFILPQSCVDVNTSLLKVFNSLHSWATYVTAFSWITCKIRHNSSLTSMKPQIPREIHPHPVSM